MKPTLHRATCAQCGNSCEVPFKPNGSKPIYCRECFRKDDSGAPKKFGGDKRFGAGAGNFPEKRMYEAVCESCGDECEVPFRPTGEKPVYCRACFGGKKNDGATDYKTFKATAPAAGVDKEQIALINIKLDAIMKALNVSVAPKAEKAAPAVEAKAEKAEAKAEAKTEAAPAKAEKKPAAKKKAPAKKKK